MNYDDPIRDSWNERERRNRDILRPRAIEIKKHRSGWYWVHAADVSVLLLIVLSGLLLVIADQGGGAELLS